MTPLSGKTPAQLAALLTRAGGRKIPVAQIEADVAAGAPTNEDGSINLVMYAAWILKQTDG